MKVSKITNNWKVKRQFSNGLWSKKGIMFPWDKRQYLQVGFFGFIFMFQWGEMI